MIVQMGLDPVTATLLAQLGGSLIGGAMQAPPDPTAQLLMIVEQRRRLSYILVAGGLVAALGITVIALRK